MSFDVVDARGLTKVYGRQRALAGVDLTLRAGEATALLGPNGAGKSTLVGILATLVSPTAGSVTYGDNEAGDDTLRGAIGVIAHESHCYGDLSGHENLVFFARMHGMRRRAAGDRAAELLDAVGLADAADRPVNAYSHGMQKRLSIARALLTEPRVLLVDEATHDLDPEGARRIRELIEEAAAEGTAVLWATQRLDEISGSARPRYRQPSFP